MPSPGSSAVFLLMSERTLKSNLESRNDCETNWVHRLLPRIRREQLFLEICALMDRPRSNAPYLRPALYEQFFSVREFFDLLVGAACRRFNRFVRFWKDPSALTVCGGC